MTEHCSVDNYYVKPFEVCNFKALLELEKINSIYLFKDTCNIHSIFSQSFSDSNPDLNSIIRTSTNEYNYEYDINKKDLCYSPNNNSNYNVNCVIAAHSPFFTYNKEKVFIMFLEKVVISKLIYTCSATKNKQISQNILV